jgi:hypothetical protein
VDGEAIELNLSEHIFSGQEMLALKPIAYRLIIYVCVCYVADRQTEVAVILFVLGCGYWTADWPCSVTVDWIWWPQAPSKNVAYVN